MEDNRVKFGYDYERFVDRAMDAIHSLCNMNDNIRITKVNDIVYIGEVDDVYYNINLKNSFDRYIDSDRTIELFLGELLAEVSLLFNIRDIYNHNGEVFDVYNKMITYLSENDAYHKLKIISYDDFKRLVLEKLSSKGIKCSISTKCVNNVDKYIHHISDVMNDTIELIKKEIEEYEKDCKNGE